MSGYLLKKRSFAILYELNHLKLEGGHHINFMNLGIIGLILSQFENRVPLKLVLEGEAMLHHGAWVADVSRYGLNVLSGGLLLK